jgi:hypothetical protein
MEAGRGREQKETSCYDSSVQHFLLQAKRVMGSSRESRSDGRSADRRTALGGNNKPLCLLTRGFFTLGNSTRTLTNSNRSAT